MADIELNENLDIDLDVMVIAEALANNPAAMRILAQAVTVAQTRQARGLPDLFGKHAQKLIPHSTQPQYPGNRRIS